MLRMYFKELINEVVSVYTAGICSGSIVCCCKCFLYRQGIRRVMVSDGLNVVPAGNDGMFSLPHRGNARFIFVTTPSGYMATEAYYMKTGTQAVTYDFPLVPYDAGIRKDGSHTFIQVTDTEIFNTDNNEEWADNIRQCATVRNAAFIVHTGDICYEKGLESHIGLMNTENMGVPVYYGIGNHDLVKGRYGEELFESIYGPAWYSFDVAGTHYVMLPMLSGDFKPSYTQDDVAAWLANDLAHVPQDTPVVVFSHNILTYGNSFLYKGTDGPGVDLDSRNLKAWTRAESITPWAVSAYSLSAKRVTYHRNCVSRICTTEHG